MSKQAIDNNAKVVPRAFRLGRTQNVAIGVATAPTPEAVNPNTRVVMIVCTVAAYIAQGPAPVATSSMPILPANYPLFLRVETNDKFACLQVTTGGTMSVTELL